MVFGLETIPEPRSNERGGTSVMSKRRSPSMYRNSIICLYLRRSSIHRHLNNFRNITIPTGNSRYLPLKAQNPSSLSFNVRPSYCSNTIAHHIALYIPTVCVDECPYLHSRIFFVECIVISVYLLFPSTKSPLTSRDRCSIIEYDKLSCL